MTTWLLYPDLWFSGRAGFRNLDPSDGGWFLNPMLTVYGKPFGAKRSEGETIFLCHHWNLPRQVIVWMLQCNYVYQKKLICKTIQQIVFRIMIFVVRFKRCYQTSPKRDTFLKAFAKLLFSFLYRNYPAIQVIHKIHPAYMRLQFFNSTLDILCTIQCT